jgi:ribosomal protein S18 acetylase RimI-like enzyme
LTGAAAAPDPVSADHIEALSLAAWPALRTEDYDGWLLRFAGGHTRRSNSVNPLRRGRLVLADKIIACERAFRAEGLPPVFRIPSITPKLELARFNEPADAALEPAPSEAWLDAFARFDGLGPAHREVHRVIVAETPYETAFAAAYDGGAIVTVGAAVLQERFVYLNAIATDAARRRRGFGRNAVAALLGWAKRHGASYAYLPVEKVNAPGLALYNQLGFRTEVYRYHYRALPGA